MTAKHNMNIEDCEKFHNGLNIFTKKRNKERIQNEQEWGYFQENLAFC
jgi:hypothetical protein